jgi:hypothetical protein
VKWQWFSPPWMASWVKRKLEVEKKRKGRSHGCCGRMPWLLVQGKQLISLLWPMHSIVITPNCVPQDMQESMVRNIVAEPHIKHLWYCSNSIAFWLSTWFDQKLMKLLQVVSK